MSAPALPDFAERNSGGFYATSALYFASYAAPVDLTVSPVTDGRGSTYTFARGIIADADGSVSLRPVGSATPVTIPVLQGVVVPVYFEAIDSFTGPTSVVVLF